MDHILQAIKGNAFAVFGRVGMDMFADPPGTALEEATQFRSDIGGSSANICVGLCKQGSKAALVTSVSDDAVGRFCVKKLGEYGVDARYVRAVQGECRTSLAVYESRSDNFQNVIYRNNAADFQVTEADVAAVDLSQFSAIISAGTVLASEPSRSATFLAFNRARKAGLPVIFDVDYRPYSWPSPEVAAEILTRAGAASDVIVGNDEEFGFMAGDIDKGLSKARDLAAQGKLVIYKMGPGGAITLARDEEIRTGIYPVEALKPVGAGDSFLSGLLAAIAQGHPLREAVLRGSASASITVSRAGCAPALPTLQELDDFLERHPGPTAA